MSASMLCLISYCVKKYHEQDKKSVNKAYKLILTRIMCFNSSFNKATEGNTRTLK